MKNNKNVLSNNQKYEQVSQSDDKSEIVIFQTNKKISVSFAVIYCDKIYVEYNWRISMNHKCHREAISEALRTIAIRKSECDVMLENFPYEQKKSSLCAMFE